MTLSDMNFIACFRGMNHKSKSLKGHFFNNELTENDIASETLLFKNELLNSETFREE